MRGGLHCQFLEVDLHRRGEAMLLVIGGVIDGYYWPTGSKHSTITGF